MKTLKESLSNKPRHLADVKINEATYTKLSVTHMVEPEIAKFAKFANNKVTSYSSDLKFDLDGRKFQVFGIPELENQTFFVRGDAEINSYYHKSLTFWTQKTNWYIKLDLDYMPNLTKLANGEKVNALVVSRKNTGSNELTTIKFI